MSLYLKTSYRGAVYAGVTTAKRMHGERHAYSRVRAIAHSGQERVSRRHVGPAFPTGFEIASCQTSESHDYRDDPYFIGQQTRIIYRCSRVESSLCPLSIPILT